MPSVLFSLRGLMKMEISDHPISALPAHGWRNLSGLRRLLLCSLQLRELPDEIGVITSLEIVFIMQNMLQALPSAFGQLPCLVQLRATGNQIRELPAPFGPPMLECLAMEGNNIGWVPADLCSSCPRLVELRLAGNPMVQGFIGSANNHAPGAFEQMSSGSTGPTSSLVRAYWMGCSLERLPESLLRASAGSLKHLLLNGNRLRAPLPDALTQLKSLEHLYLCGNCLDSLPEGLFIGCEWLQRCLLEDNPLSATALDAILCDVHSREVSSRPLRLLGLDATQVRRWSSSTSMLQASIDRGGIASENLLPLACSHMLGEERYMKSCQRPPLAACVQSGWSVMPGSPWYAKLMPSSQVKRSAGAVTLGERAGEADLPVDAESRVLMVAFAASQGEPEWAGELGRLHEQRQHRLALWRCSLRSTLAERVEAMRVMSPHLPHTDGGLMASLWAGYNRAWEEPRADGDSSSPVDHNDELDCGDFDVLLLVDPHRSWYTLDHDSLASLDYSSFRKDLEGITSRYRRVCAMGVSMGGFAAMSCADLFDTVLAFGPQIDLEFAHHRPGFDTDVLRAMSQRMKEAVANRRGTVEVHTSMDTHLAQAQLLHADDELRASAGCGRAGDLRLVVHPLIGRIAQLLASADLLLPLLANALNRLQHEAPNEPIVDVDQALLEYGGTISSLVAVSGPDCCDKWPAWQWPCCENDGVNKDGTADVPSILVGVWSTWVRRTADGADCAGGWIPPGLEVVRCKPDELLKLVRHAPQPGEWLCPGCGSFNESDWAKCGHCHKVNFLDHPCLVTVPGGGCAAFRIGDWECSSCERLVYRRDSSCRVCGRQRHPSLDGSAVVQVGDNICSNAKCSTKLDAILASVEPFRCDLADGRPYCNGCWGSWERVLKRRSD